MSSERDNVQIVEAVYAAFGRGDIETVLGMLTDDIEWVEPGPPDLLPWAGLHRGREQVGEFFRALDEAVEFQAFEPREFITDGARVVVLGSDRLRVKSSGRVAEAEWAMVFTVREGKIARFQDFSDTAAFVAAMRGV